MSGSRDMCRTERKQISREPVMKKMGENGTIRAKWRSSCGGRSPTGGAGDNDQGRRGTGRARRITKKKKGKLKKSRMTETRTNVQNKTKLKIKSRRYEKTCRGASGRPRLCARVRGYNLILRRNRFPIGRPGHPRGRTRNPKWDQRSENIIEGNSRRSYLCIVCRRRSEWKRPALARWAWHVQWGRRPSWRRQRKCRRPKSP